MIKRPSIDEYYLNIAKAVSLRSTCLRRKYGAVIVNNDEIISTGYNGSPRGRMNCIDSSICERERLEVPKGERYELCEGVHAEQNAIISASRKDMIGSTLYIAGSEVKTGEIADCSPCLICEKLIINAGIYKIAMQSPEGVKIKELNIKTKKE